MGSSVWPPEKRARGGSATRKYRLSIPISVLCFVISSFIVYDLLFPQYLVPIVGLLFSSSVAQHCETTTLESAAPASGTEAALQSFSYCGGTLEVSAYIANLDYDKLVTLYYTNRQNVSTPLSAVSLGYNSSITNTNFELWGASTPIYIDGITELLNLTFEATDLDQTYVQQLHIPVFASGSAAPSTASPLLPYATPSGLAQDISTWLQADAGSEATIALTRMLININPNVTGAVNGTVVAAQSGPSFADMDPDYEYHWVRDSSLTMDVVKSLYAAATNADVASAYETILFEYAVRRAMEQTDPGLQTGLGEPKFFLNSTIFTGPWGRPVRFDGANLLPGQLLTHS